MPDPVILNLIRYLKPTDVGNMKLAATGFRKNIDRLEFFAQHIRPYEWLRLRISNFHQGYIKTPILTLEMLPFSNCLISETFNSQDNPYLPSWYEYGWTRVIGWFKLLFKQIWIHVMNIISAQWVKKQQFDKTIHQGWNSNTTDKWLTKSYLSKFPSNMIKISRFTSQLM